MTTPVDQASFAELVQRFNTLLDSWEATGGSGLTAAGAAALDAAVDADGGASNQMIGLTTGGALKRFTTNLFASRRTQDLDVLPGSEYAEWMNCLSSTGLERKIAVGALTRSFGDVIDPTRPPYNVVFDAQKVINVNFANGSNVVNFPNNSTFTGWKQSDIGKLAAVSNHVGSYYGQDAYIGHVSPDGKQIQLFLDQAFTQPANAPRDGNGYEQMVWGTDGTAGMQAACDAADPLSYEGHGQTVALGGFTLLRRLRFGNISIVGLATTTCGFFQISAGPSSGGPGDPWISLKSNGLYDSSHRPHHYCLINMTLFAQKYTCNYGYLNYREALQIYSGGFYDVYTGAPYARLEGIDIYDSPMNGFFGDGVFAGLMKDMRAFQSRNAGFRVSFYDLNGENWHAEGNGFAGVQSGLSGANIFGVRCSYNGGAPDSSFIDETGSNYTECGFGNTVTNLRLQESYSHNLCITDIDYQYNIVTGRGRNNAFYLGTFDDTADISGLAGGASANIRAMVYLRKTGDVYNSAEGPAFNTVDLVTGSYQVRNVNYATNGVGVEGLVRNNRITLGTPNITNSAADWASPNALSPGPWASKNMGSDTIGSLGNVVTVNGQTAP